MASQPTYAQLKKNNTILSKQKAFAWAKMYEMEAERFEERMASYNQLHEQLTDDATEDIPLHLMTVIRDLYEKAKEHVECSICLEVISKETLDITHCGHTFHKDCIKTLKDTAKAHGDTAKCPCCRKGLRWWIKIINLQKN